MTRSESHRCKFKHFVFVFQVLAGDDGKALQEFKSDPIRFIPYILGFELRGDSRHIAQKIYNKYFSNDPTENGQLKAFTQVCSEL